ncbi:MAG: SusD/RagB family nutrient-binding outer membrane lipoprotein [Bacteroidetes bacterium]|nr:SusD/RagB family nutrient-binding outer membrane lipoprotein [Bacteroidota bacterium]
MKNAIKTIKLIGLVWLFIIVSVSCGKFETLNTDPNNISPSIANANYLMAQVLTSTAREYGDLGSGDMSGAMQQTAQDAWSSGYSNYSWDPKDWSGYYGRLRDNKLLLQKATENNFKFHQGVALVMRAFNFGCIADLWGDAPYSKALNGDQVGPESTTPVFDSQEDIYNGVIADLKAALPLLQGSAADFPEVNKASDVFYQGEPANWRKLANSLLLRYYLRISDKKDVKADVEALVGKVFESNNDDWAMSYPGKDGASSYKKNSKFDIPSNYNRNKMSATLVKTLDALKDPRIVIMAEPIKTRTRLDASMFPGDNTTLSKIVGGIRYINPPAAIAARDKQFNLATYSVDRPWAAPANTVWNFFDTAEVYVGIPISYANETYQYNLNSVGVQANSNNDYVSYMRRDIYNNPSGPLLKARMASYNEICFDFAEAAQKGWNVGGSAEEWYNKGIKASFDLWLSNYQNDVNNYSGCVKNYADYIAQPLVKYDGTLQRIMEQKWIASWQASVESWMDWRRTGFPHLEVGWASFREQLPVRFAYFNTELQNNPENSAAAIEKLQETDYSTVDGKNSSWSKFWLIQGTNKPW